MLQAPNLSISNWQPKPGVARLRILAAPARVEAKPSGRFSSNRDSSGANQILNAKRLKHADHRFDFFNVTGNFNRVSGRRRIDDFGAKDIRNPDCLVPMLGFGMNLDQCGFAIKKIGFRQIDRP